MSKTIFDLFQAATNVMSSLMYLIIALALLGFMWGIVRVLFSGGSEKLKKEGKDFMLYGILILFVMTSLWGLVYLFRNFILDNTGYGDVDSGSNEIDSPNVDPFENPDQLFEPPAQVAV
jgi:hypothetical protein